MYEVAKKAREAMKGKARRLAGEKDSKVDSSNWTQAEPMNADVKTGLRPISPRQFKKGGLVASGASLAAHAGRRGACQPDWCPGHLGGPRVWGPRPCRARPLLYR